MRQSGNHVAPMPDGGGSAYPAYRCACLLTTQDITMQQPGTLMTLNSPPFIAELYAVGAAARS